MGIRFQNVAFSYDGKASTLKDINLTIDTHDEFIAILGHTGSGKSTLVQLMNALNLPTKGSVNVNDITILPNNKTLLKPIRKHVGLVFQFPEYQLFEETVLKDVMFGPKNFLDKKIAGKELEEKAIKALKMVGLPRELYERSPFNLSGGQMRRVAIAGILASEPDILVLDEPTVGLDPRGKTSLMETLVKIQKETSKTIILITHDMNIVAEYAKRCIVLDDGQIVYDGQKRRLFAQYEFLKKHNLDYPDITKVAISLKNKGLITYKDVPLTKKELYEVIIRGDNLE